MPTLNKESKTVTYDDLMNNFESAFQQVQAISEDYPQKAQMLYDRLLIAQLDLLNHELHHLINPES